MRDMTKAFERWLKKVLPTVSLVNPVDIHIDELIKDPDPTQQLEASAALFRWVVANCKDKLIGRAIELLIPLRDSDALDMHPPDWSTLAAQLSRKPASIYVVEVEALVRVPAAQIFTAPTKVPPLDDLALPTSYRCWRNIDDPVEEGWSRDVGVTCLFLRGA
jgi:hypothetical protein